MGTTSAGHCLHAIWGHGVPCTRLRACAHASVQVSTRVGNKRCALWKTVPRPTASARALHPRRARG
eukprot:685793-Prymnesium_polylepis.1